MNSEPGQTFAYSNPGCSLLAAIIERVSGRPYEAFLHRNLFEPAVMRATGYRLAKWDSSHIAHGYMNVGCEGTPLDHEWAEWGP